jgi:hypothetical protein
MATYQLPESDVGPLGVVDKPPDVTKYGGSADINTDNHVAEQQPTADESLVTAAGRALHNVMVWRVERQSSGGKTIGDKVNPQELDRNQSLGHAQGSSQEDRHDLSDVGRD